MSFALRLAVTVVAALVASVAFAGRPGADEDSRFALADVGVSAAGTVRATTVVSNAPAPAEDAPVSVSVSVSVPLPAPASAPEPLPLPPAEIPVDASSVERRGAAAAALVPFPIERTGYELIFAGHRDGYLGLTSTVNRTITIYIRSSQTAYDIAKVIAHEVGHAIDVDFTTPTERFIYRHIRGIDARPWYPDCSGCTDYDSPAGDFAETFAMAMLGDSGFLSSVADPPTAAQLHALASIFTI